MFGFCSQQSVELCRVVSFFCNEAIASKNRNSKFSSPFCAFQNPCMASSIYELFSEVGDLKRCTVHYDRSGRSKGTAEVVFSRRKDAEAAVKRYNNVQLDGKPMKIEILGTNIATAAAAVPPATNVMKESHNGAPRSQGRGGYMGRPRGGSGGLRRGRGPHGQGRDRGGKVSAEDLDADLEKYHGEAMQTN
ncbi:unnamed protein product [Ilex paraguariensis]|uniref:RRM domain-containing protein n=1 Tax=Ilex paraguariensis TaxID=185542 RepID=A0ABC8V484_9AQUA